MEDARRLFESGCPDGTVVVAEFQTRGRGRAADRSWVADAGRNLLFTVVLRREGGGEEIGAAVQRLPLLAGLAVALSVERLYGLAVELKWPNDLLVEGKKLAGILCEALVDGRSLGVLIGIGLNGNQLFFPPQLESGATSLAREVGSRVDLYVLLPEVLLQLQGSLGDADWRGKVVRRLHGLDRRAVWVSAPESIGERGGVGGRPGILLDLNADGSLLFKPDDGEPLPVYGGEIRFVHGPQQ
jgi:BirA family biotin operon repressor/biotin-[acetyl-CoA-carboxylase] ligase